MIARAVRDFPEPDSPTRATRSTPTSKEIASTMRRCGAAVDLTVRPRTESSARSPMARVADVAQAIRQRIEGETEQENGRTGKRRYPPLGRIALSIRFGSDIDESEARSIVEEAERLCTVNNTLLDSPAIEIDAFSASRVEQFAG